MPQRAVPSSMVAWWMQPPVAGGFELVEWVVGGPVVLGALELCVVLCVGAGFAECAVELGAAGAGAAAAEEDVGAALVAVARSVDVAESVATLELWTPAPTAACGGAVPGPVPVVDDWQAAAAKTVIAQAKADAQRCRSMGSPPGGPAPAAGQGPTLAEFGCDLNA